MILWMNLYIDIGRGWRDLRTECQKILEIQNGDNGWIDSSSTNTSEASDSEFLKMSLDLL